MYVHAYIRTYRQLAFWELESISHFITYKYTTIHICIRFLCPRSKQHVTQDFWWHLEQVCPHDYRRQPCAENTRCRVALQNSRSGLHALCHSLSILPLLLWLVRVLVTCEASSPSNMIISNMMLSNMMVVTHNMTLTVQCMHSAVTMSSTAPMP